MAELNTDARKKLPAKDFAEPKKRGYCPDRHGCTSRMQGAIAQRIAPPRCTVGVAARLALRTRRSRPATASTLRLLARWSSSTEPVHCRHDHRNPGVIASICSLCRISGLLWLLMQLDISVGN